MLELDDIPFTMDPEYQRRRKLRVTAKNRFYDWVGKPNNFASLEFSQFLGYLNYSTLRTAHIRGEDELENKLKALTGPHGYAVYKALAAKRNT